jgi:8-oxo-dGTP pyrophosphatase MutT (NUDIX family)
MEQRRLASTEWVDIVNEENEVIAQASREQMRAQCLRHRATYIVVHDGMGKILVQRRTETKDFLPGMLDATAGGVVQADEQLLESARREAEEELGIAVSGAHCSAASLTVPSHYRKMKSVKFAG